MGGAESARTFFKHPFLHEKRGLEVQNFVTFPNSLWTFRKSKKIFLVFHSVLRWSRRCGLIQPPPRSQATSRSPAPLGLSPFLDKFCEFFHNLLRKCACSKLIWIQNGVVVVIEPSEILKYGNNPRLKQCLLSC